MPKLATPKRASNEVVKLAEEMAELVAEMGMHELKLQHKEHFIRMRRRGGEGGTAAPAPTAGKAPAAEPTLVLEEFGTPVVCQNVGVFHLQASVATGTTVESNQTMGWVESMGIRQELLAPRAGTVVEILAESGDPVEYGQVLMIIT